jgi:hypothetical protein
MLDPYQEHQYHLEKGEGGGRNNVQLEEKTQNNEIPHCIIRAEALQQGRKEDKNL